MTTINIRWINFSERKVLEETVISCSLPIVTWYIFSRNKNVAVFIVLEHLK